MNGQYIRLLWVGMPMVMIALAVGAQSDESDKSPHKSGFITVNNVKLHYLDWGGAGETLLFLHGMGGTAHHYDDFAPRFTNQFRVLGLTRRGNGESEMPETGYDTPTLVEDIRQFLDALKVRRAVLAGHSFAGDELTRFAVMHPDRVIKLIYFDSAYDHSRVPENLRFKPLHGVVPELLPTKEESESPDGGRRWVMRIWGEKTGRTIYSMIEGTYAEKHEYARIKAPTLAFFAIGYCPASPANSKCQGFDEKKVLDWVESLPDPQRKDAQEFVKAQRKYYEQEIEHFRREIPNGRTIVFTNADHVCFFDREPEVLHEMRAFLAPSEWRDESPHKTRFITVNGVRLHYLDWGGKGETLLFLHGLGDTAHIYDELAPKFTNQFRVLGLTRRGHGQSDKPETGYDTATLTEDIRQFLEALTIRHVILVGHSIAGDELTRFAGAHPDRVTKLVYLDAAYDRAGLPEIMKERPPELSPTKTDMESLDSFRRWVGRMSFWSEAWEANLREMMEFSADGKILREAKPAKASRLLMQGTVDSHPDYTKIRSPALNIAVVGFSARVSDFVQTLPDSTRAKAESALSKVKGFQQLQIERFRKELPSARVVVLTNADHHCFIHRQDEVLREMREFLSDMGSRKPRMIFPPFVDLQIPLAPTPVKANGKQCLVYELHLTNFFTNKLELTRVEVLKDGAKGPMATYTDEELSRRLKPGVLLTVVAKELHIESPSDELEHHVISRGNRAVMYMLTTVQREADIPAALHHRLFFKSHSAENSEEVVVEGARVTVDRKAPLVLSPPLRGEGWVAAEGPSNDNHHRRNIFVTGGKARIPARFAIDWTRIGADGRLVHGDRANNTNWYPYGAEVLAVANAVVADVKDGIPENEGGTNKWNVSLTLGTNKWVSLEAAAGNYVMLDLGKSNFAVYAHLQPKSIRVRVGQKVRRGQVLGLLGNSGDSYSPHLHFHVANDNSLFGAEGVPYVFESFEVQGVAPITNGPSLDEAWKPPPNAKTDRRRMEIPTENAVIRFP